MKPGSPRKQRLYSTLALLVLGCIIFGFTREPFIDVMVVLGMFPCARILQLDGWLGCGSQQSTWQDRRRS